MARITTFKGYQGEPPVPRPAAPPAAHVVTPRDGVPVRYPGCDGIENTGDETMEVLICTTPPNP